MGHWRTLICSYIELYAETHSERVVFRSRRWADCLILLAIPIVLDPLLNQSQFVWVAPFLNLAVNPKVKAVDCWCWKRIEMFDWVDLCDVQTRWIYPTYHISLGMSVFFCFCFFTTVANNYLLSNMGRFFKVTLGTCKYICKNSEFIWFIEFFHRISLASRQ